LAEIRDLLEWFGISRTRQAVHYWFHVYAEACEQEFTAEPDRVAVDGKQIQLPRKEKVWLYAAIDVDSKVVLHV
jgi:transposase-like protein